MQTKTAEFPGATVTPGDARYPTLVRGFNQRWVGDPTYVQVVGNAQQVVDTVQKAVDANARIAVRSGGHCYEGWSSLTNGVIIDVSSMNAAGWDDTVQAFFIEGGCTNWDVQNQLYRQYGVTLPGGSCYSVGAGGHICGGGYGLLSRLHGLTVDWLYGIEGVFVDTNRKARWVRVTRDSPDPAEQDLVWAHTGGGGGNFGVITRYLFKTLPQAPSEAMLSSVAWEWSDLLQNPNEFANIIQSFGEFFAQNSGVGSPFAGMFSLLHLTRKAAGQIVMTTQDVGASRTRIDALLAAIQSRVNPRKVPLVAPRVPVGWHHLVSRSQDMRVMPWLEVTQTLNGSGPNQRGKYKSAYMMQPFPQSQYGKLWQWLTVENSTYPANSQALLQVDSYGCQINAIAPSATAVPQRSSIMKLQYQTYWTEPSQDAQNLAWIRDFYRDMYGPQGPYPDGTFDGCYVNYCDSDLVNWQFLYYKNNYQRLQKAKYNWDRHNIFNHPQSIELPPVSGPAERRRPDNGALAGEAEVPPDPHPAGGSRTFDFAFHPELSAIPPAERPALAETFDRLAETIWQKDERFWREFPDLWSDRMGSVLARTDGELVGFFLYERVVVDDKSIFYIHGINVHPRLQSSGLQGQLWTKAVPYEAAHARAGTIYVAARTRNPLILAIISRICSKLIPGPDPVNDDPELRTLALRVSETLYPGVRVEQPLMIIRDAYTNFSYLQPQHHRDRELDAKFYGDTLGARDVYFVLGMLHLQRSSADGASQ